jgi:predicted GNAT superfamily acetyltransferase
METLTIRPVRPDDFAQVLAINAEGYPGVTRLTLAELNLARELSPYFGVAEHEAQVIGYIITYRGEQEYDGDEFNWFKQNFSNFLYIDQIAIAASARRLRVGTQFYHHLEQVAQELGLTSLVCEVNLEPPNPISLNFHARQGFGEVGTMTTQDGRRVSLRRKVLINSVHNVDNH